MKNAFQKILPFLWKLIKWFFLLSICSVIIFRFIPIPFTPLMFIRLGEQLFDKEREVQWKKTWKPLSSISPALPLAVITSEDQKFEDHFGLDMEAIQKATEYNDRHKNKKRGASTISQQVAKNVFLWPSRSYIRKGFELYFTLLIEIFWSKHRIMEVYLNVIELGNGIYGAESAAQYYFKKPAAKLTVGEAASLVAVLPLPLKWSPVNPNARVVKRKNWILSNMRNIDVKDF
jgi:monofunctional biosynthetic peptidoglycan transglycosylase